MDRGILCKVELLLTDLAEEAGSELLLRGIVAEMGNVRQELGSGVLLMESCEVGCVI